MRGKKVSVIIPCYNGARFLPEAIESVLAQTYREFEIIVVDDGSTDNSGVVARSYSGVRVIRQENQGVAVARNTGLCESRGDCLVFLDQDDRLLPNALEVGVNHLNSHLDCGFVFGLFRFIGPNGVPLPRSKRQVGGAKKGTEREAKVIGSNIETANYQEHFDYKVLLSGRTLVPPSTAMFRRAVFQSVGDFDPSVVPMDDYDTYLRAARAFPICCHNQVIVEYRQHLGNQSRRNNARELAATLRVLDAQKDFVKGNKDREVAYRIGRKKWIRLWGRGLPYDIAHSLIAGRFSYAVRCTLLLLRYYPQGFFWFPIHLLTRLAQHCCG